MSGLFKVLIAFLFSEIEKMFPKLCNCSGIKDFLPTHTQDTHENFTFVMDKAARWAAEQTDISLSNMQAVFIKKKGIIFLRSQAPDSENLFFCGLLSVGCNLYSPKL